MYASIKSNLKDSFFVSSIGYYANKNDLSKLL